jgi:DNA adenine methylase
VSPALKWPGGKGPLADWIISHFPPHQNYVEPFFGGGAVLLAKDPDGVSEVVNDLDRGVSNFWNVLKHPHTFEAFSRVMEATPFSEVEYRTAAGLLRSLGWHEVPTEGDLPTGSTDACVLRACNFFVACRQSLAGRMESFASISTSRVRRGQNEQVSAWLTAVEGLPAVHQRLKRVLILNRDANEVVRQFDKPDTVIYCDPPYVPETRTSPNVYRHEMTLDQHEAFLKTVLGVKHAFVAVSGYRNELYDRMLKDWRRVDKVVANHAAHAGKEKRKMTESLYLSG